MDKYYEAILKPMNQCDYTGVERMDSVEMVGEYAVVSYMDSVGNLRANLVLDGEPIAGVLFTHTGECVRRYTKKKFRGQHLSRDLFALMSYKYPKMNLRHSQNMTKAGAASV